MSLLHLFSATFLVGAFTYGSGFAIVPVLKALFVDKTGWVSQSDFSYAMAVGQMTPGPLTIFVAFLGWRMAGVPGAAVATIGLYLPGFFAVVILSRIYRSIRDHPRISGALWAIRPTVAALILKVTIDFARELGGGKSWAFVLVAAAFGLMSFTPLNPGWLFGACFLAGIFWPVH